MALTQVSTGGIKDGQVQTADLADGQVTVGKLHADALDHTYTLGADGSNHYTFTGEGLTGAVNDPTLYLTRGKTYRFVNGNSAGAHPFRIQTTVNGSAGTEYNTGVTNNGGAGGSTIVFEVPHDAPDVLYYQCTSHNAMGGILYVTGALADGTVTTAKLAADAVTGAKIADQAVTLAKLPHGTSSNDGKFLRANNGADPTFESIPSGVTINNQADNRVITATGTTDTLNAESNVVIDSSGKVKIGTTNGNPHANADELTLGDPSGTVRSGMTINSGANKDGSIHFGDPDSNLSGQITYDHNGDILRFYTANDKRVRIDSDGLKFGNDTAAANALDDYEEGEYDPTITLGSGSVSLNSSYNTLRYTKIGRQVTITGQLVFFAHSSGGGTLNISLPFANGNGSDRSEYTLAAGCGFFSQTNSSSPTNAVQAIGLLITANSSNATVWGLHPNYDTTIGNWVGSGSDIWMNLTYFTDA